MFRYEVALGDEDPDGVSIAAGALGLNGGTIADARSGVGAASLALGAHVVTNASGHRVDSGLGPAGVSAVTVGPAFVGDTFERGETIEVTVTFNKAVAVTGTPRLALTLASGVVQADYASGAGTASLVFRYEVAQADVDANGLGIAEDALTLNGGTIRVSGGTVDAVLDLGTRAIVDSGDHKVAGGTFTAAAVSRAAIVSTPANGTTFGMGELIEVEVGFDRPVTVTGSPQLELGIGGETRLADYVPGTGADRRVRPGPRSGEAGPAARAVGTRTLGFRYRVAPSDADNDGISVGANALVLNRGTIADARDPAAPADLGIGANAIVNSGAHMADGTLRVPVVSAVTVVSSPGSGDTYARGEPITVRVEFSLAVAVTGAPRLALTLGGATAQADYVSGAGTPALLFRYTVLGTDADPDGLSIGSGALTLGGGGTVVRAGSSVNAALGLATHEVSDDAAHKVDGSRAPAPGVERLRERLKGVNAAILPDLSRAMAASTVDAVSGRIGRGLSADGGGASGGAAAARDVLDSFTGLLESNEQAIMDGAWSWKEGLDGREFAFSLTGGGGAGAGAGEGAAPGGADAGAGPRVIVWGAGDYRNLGGGEGGPVEWDGHLFSAHAGVDARFGAGGLAGLALSWSDGSFDYTDRGPHTLEERVEGKYESRMTSAWPYLGWSWRAGTHVWASLGYGEGEVTIDDGETGRQKSSANLRGAAVGGSARMHTQEDAPGLFGPMNLDLKGEAWATRLEVDDNGDAIARLAVRTHRLRMSAEGSRRFGLGGGDAVLTPSVELGLRVDGGDGETGAGVEFGGGLDWERPSLGLGVDVSGQALVAHEGEAEEWSVGGAVRLDPASGRGLSLRVAPSYGEAGSGLGRLWEQGVDRSGGPAGASSNGAEPAVRVDAEMGYGLAKFAGVLTPYGGLSRTGGGAHGYRLGVRFRLGAAFELGLEGEHRTVRAASAGQSLMLRGRIRW